MGEQDQGGGTALHCATLSSGVTEAKSRLAAGDDPNSVDLEGFTPLHLAAVFVAHGNQGGSPDG